MSKHTPTPEQHRAILRDGHTLIEAGAGSGKTTTLVDKIVYLLEQGCELGSIAAITFTNASAADFRTKLRKRLRARAGACAAEGDSAGERVWKERVHEVDRARIGTIHSFCGSVLREFGLRIGLDPRFRILDEGESAMLREACTRDVLRAALEADGSDAVDLCASFGVNGAESLVKAVVCSGTTLDEVLGKWYSGDPVARARTVVTELRTSLGLGEDEGVWDDAFDGEATRLAGCALRLARAVRAAMDERMTRESVLDYDALIERTLAAVQDRADVRGALRARLRWLFIDEFQDTDGAQLAIAEAIALLDEPLTERSPRLCIVGDPKQSIYRFRGADVTVWTRAVQRFRAIGVEPIPLAVNFRSVEPIVGFVNETFDGLIGAGRPVVVASGHEVAFARLLPHRRQVGASPCVELLAPDGDTGGNADARRSREARTIAARLCELRHQPWHDDDGTLQPAPRPWKDFALLFRTRAPMAKAEEELRALGIPCYVAGGSGFFARREVRDIRLLLRALADPADDVAWLGLLRSPFVGLTDAALLAMRAAGVRFSEALVAGSFARDDDRAVVPRARTWIEPLCGLRDRIPVSELVELAVDRSGFGAHLLALPGGRLALANVRKLVRMAEGRAGETIGEMLAWMEEREGSEARDGDAALYTAGEDVVTLSTVHGAKGLEWPVVVLADLVERDIVSKGRTERWYADASAGVGVKVVDTKERVSAAWTCLDRRNLLLSRAEEKRLWYVAATRARDLLVLCASRVEVDAARLVADADADARYATQWLLRKLAPGEGSFAFGEWTAQESLVVPRAEPFASDALGDRQQPQEFAPGRLAAHAAAAPLPRRSATELMELAQGEEGWRDRYARGSWFRRATGIAPRVLGDVVHGALEHLRDARELHDYLEAELVRASGESAGSEVIREAVERARLLVASASGHPDVVRFTSAGAEHELEFTWFVHTETGAHHVRGAMDLVAVIDGVPEILDYKSTAIAAGGEGEAAAPYRLQRDTYALALSAVLGTAPGKFTFLFPATGGAHAAVLDAAVLGKGLEEVRRLLDRAVGKAGA